MATATTDTRTALIEAAGRLFAENGLEGTGTRAIAEAAGSNIGSIHYYFGGKANLYRASVEHVLDLRVTQQNIRVPVPDRSDPAGVSNLLQLMVCKRFAASLGTAAPRWHTRLIVRLFTEGPEDVFVWVDNRILKPDFELFLRIVRLARPGIGGREARKIFYVFISQLVFYAQRMERMGRIFDTGADSPLLTEELAQYAALSVTRTLGLPDPADEPFGEE